MSKNILVDCGGNLGQGFKELQKLFGINEKWDVVIFEPNTNCLPKLRHNLRAFNYIKIINKAVDTNNDTAKLYIPNDSEVSQGATIKEGILNKAVERDLGGYGNNFNVECICLSEYISDIDEDYNIYLKLDVEGAEYAILEHMINQNTLSRVSYLFVEFHNRFVDEDKRKEYDTRRENILSYIRGTCIKFTEWH